MFFSLLQRDALNLEPTNVANCVSKGKSEVDFFSYGLVSHCAPSLKRILIPVLEREGGRQSWLEHVTKRGRIVITEKDVERNVEKEKNRKQR